MTDFAEEILRAAVRLSLDERVCVAVELLASVDAEIEERDAEAWAAREERREARRRRRGG